MRRSNFLLILWGTLSLVSGLESQERVYPQKRQDNNGSVLPTLNAGNTKSGTVTITSDSASVNTQTVNAASNTAPPSSSQPASNSATVAASAVSSVNVASSASHSLTPTAASATATPSGKGNATTAATDDDTDNSLPLDPQITPAFAIGGVILIITGIVYTVIGVKNRWIHIFLSTAYLTSLSITVLIVYVANPPISNAIQGAYFVGIFMTGVIFGAGALIFKEVTEGLGCLLGGFCVSMWFLTLKEGGLITSTGGKAIFIAAFSVVAWSLSFSHYTRAYGLMVSVAFSGATAFILGIDCFSRGGLKEFWVYLWDLNDNIFPLNTNTYPISRGTRVETIVIILATIIGIISQIKLWKIVKDRQKQRDAAQEEETRRREAVEVALGRHLERQNDRDRTQWEKQYGDRLTAKRETILWTDAHGEKGYSKLKETELHGSQNSSSSESLEMTNMSRKPRSVYVTRIARSSAVVTPIQEVEEGDTAGHKAQVRQQVLERLESNAGDSTEHDPSSSTAVSTKSQQPHSARSSFEGDREEVSGAVSDQSPIAKGHEVSGAPGQIFHEHKPNDKRHSNLSTYLSAPDQADKKKRRSFTSLLSRSKDGDNHSMTQSQEALVVPGAALHHSRASSLAATLDFENENLEFPPVDLDVSSQNPTPEIVVSHVEATKPGTVRPQPRARPVSPIEPEFTEEHLDIDPEEFVRPMTQEVHMPPQARRMSSGPSFATKRQSMSEVGTEILFDEVIKSRTSISETTLGETLTKDALELMPSQLSNVVLSYRTNEWAKHISTAEAPLVEEPQPMAEVDETEAPTHLADPTTPYESKRSSLTHTLPPEAPPPVPSALPSPTDGIRINPALQHEETLVSPIVKPPQSVIRVRSTSDIKLVPRGLRSTSTPMLVKQGAQSSVMNESMATSFMPKQGPLRSTSSQSVHGYEVARSPSVGPGMVYNYPTLHKSGSRLSLVSESGVPPARSASQMSSYGPSMQFYHQGPYQHNGIQAVPSRSETRLQSYDSHQPLRRNESFENQRREAMFTDWRVLQTKSPVQQSITDTHRRQMLAERQQIKMMEEQEKNFKWQQELATDTRMRGKDMQELHREAMRRMQAGVNKKMTN